MPVFQLGSEIVFPPPELAEPDGLLAIGGDLSPGRLLEAYRSGIFPWFGEGDPILWWTPSPRLVLFPGEFHVSRRLARVIRQESFTVSADTCFSDIIARCADKRAANRDETWITKEMREAYIRLHELGYAHSMECWQDGRLAGGLYGLALDRVFFGESMFSDITNASKIALHALVRFALENEIGLIDCQMRTGHLERLGAREISRSRFQKLLRLHIREVTPQKNWRLR